MAMTEQTVFGILFCQFIKFQPKNWTVYFIIEAPEGNPGPCGAGTVVYKPNHEPVQIRSPVCKKDSILLGEPVAILQATEHMIQNLLLKIFCDSQSAISILILGWKNTSYKDVTTDINKGFEVLMMKDVPVQIKWTPGHSAIAWNEVAGHLAKEATNKAETITDEPKFTSTIDFKLAPGKLWQKH